MCNLNNKFSKWLIRKIGKNNYNVYRIEVNDINTNNIAHYFNQYTILSIIPNINPIYEKAINIKEYQFDNNKTIGLNIKEFSDIYINVLKENAFNIEASKCMYDGIKIKQLKIYVTNNQLNKILQNKNFKLLS